jgi:integrase
VRGGTPLARKRYQTGCLFKRGKRRKVWVGRWREDVLLDTKVRGRINRSAILGSVAELPTRRDALAKLAEQLRSVNQGTLTPESTVLFGTFADEQWTIHVLPTLKLSTQHGYKNVLAKHVLPQWRTWRLREIRKLDVQEWITGRFRHGLGWQTVRNAWTLFSGILETAVEYGYLATNPGRGVKFPQKALKEAPAIIAGLDFAKLISQLNEPHRTMVGLIAATGLRVGELLALRWRALDLSSGTLAVRESVFEGTFQRPSLSTASSRLSSAALTSLTRAPLRGPLWATIPCCCR